MWAVLHGGMIYGIKSTYDRSTRVEGKIVTEYWSTPVLYSVGSFVYTRSTTMCIHHHPNKIQIAEAFSEKGRYDDHVLGVYGRGLSGCLSIGWLLLPWWSSRYASIWMNII
jgi:hypothetical protein